MFEITVEIPEEINPANGGSYSLSRLVTVQIGAAQMAKLAQQVAVQLRLHLTAFGVGMLGFIAGFGVCWLVFVR